MASPSAPGPESAQTFETIAPVAVTPGHAPGAADRSLRPADAAAGIPARRVIAALAVLLALGGLLLWALSRPRVDLPPVGTAPGTAVAPPVAADAAPVVSVTPAPWDDPAALQARQSAQTLAEGLATRRERLLARGVEAWAPEAFGAAETQAAQAAEAFAQRRFVDAAAAYRAADAAYAALEAELPERREQALAALVAALDALDAAAVETALLRARPLAADAPDWPVLEARAAAVPRVQAAIATAAAAEAEADWARAAEAYRAALAADAASPPARDGLARVNARQQGLAFQQHLGEALAALDAGQLAAAERALAQAAALRADDAGLRAAQQRLRGLQNEAALNDALQAGTAAVAAENWSAAVAAFERALQRDPSRVSAQEGLARAQARAALDGELQALRERPQRLQAAAVREQTAGLLDRARAVADPGPRLQAQIEAVANALRLASTPVPVRLLSDGETEVTVYRVGVQGRFRERELSLLPGAYVAVGGRAGYQDVRVEFEVRAGEPARVQVQTEVPL